MNYPAEVRLVEVGPRDGLQNEASKLSVEQKSTLVDYLSNSGLRVIETGSFVSPRWVPQMANSTEVFNTIERKPGVRYSALTPNERGLRDAMAADADEVAIFVAVTESFSQKNLNASIQETLDRYQSVLKIAQEHQLPVRGYLSCVLGCPYEGDVNPEQVTVLTQQLLEAGCYEVSLGDTIGTGTAGSMSRLLETLFSKNITTEQIAMHCHDTYGQALANIVIALQHGIATIDVSVAGLGGCPYAIGATGNVATEDVIYLLNGLGIKHGVELSSLLKASDYICTQLGRETQSRAGRALQLNQSGS
ncbi:MAG: hydroxymethylglutaryl-CoA lyase [Granulosicoccus sp.]|jgi:hydroxymethylglutaryl-CoA lyase